MKKISPNITLFIKSGIFFKKHHKYYSIYCCVYMLLFQLHDVLALSTPSLTDCGDYHHTHATVLLERRGRKKDSPLNDQLPLVKEKMGFSSCLRKEIGIFWFEVASRLPAYENGNTVYSVVLPHMHTWVIMDSEQIIQNNRPLFWVVLCFRKVHRSFLGF